MNRLLTYLTPLCLLWAMLTPLLGQATEPTPTTSRPAQNQEAVFEQALQCLGKDDMSCVELGLNKLPISSKLFKVLSGAIAGHKQDVDEAFKWLLPLQNDTTLSGSATLRLHHTLAWAYYSMEDPLRALQQYALAETKLNNPSDIERNQSALWALISGLDRDALVALRGESEDTETLGWIDLAISITDGQSWKTWRTQYPDHPAKDSWLATLNAASSSTSVAASSQSGFRGKVALLLPLSVPNFTPMSDAIERGFSAARQLAGDAIEVQLIATDGSKELIPLLYDKALRDEANFVVGPLTRDEVTQLTKVKQAFPTLTLALNQPEAEVLLPNFHAFGLSAETEAEQLARYGRDAGYQSALIIANETTLSMRMSKVFHDAWVAEGGHILSKVSIKKTATLDELTALMANQPLSDMIVLAVDNETGRMVRPAILNATPIFGFSHLHSGIDHDPADSALRSVHFIDMPWLLSPNAFDKPELRQSAQELPPGQMQRWFALGVDAYNVLRHFAMQPNQTATIKGLTGQLTLQPNGNVVRQLALGQFTDDGIILEKQP